MSLVIDTSVALAWYFEDEATDATDGVLRRLTSERAFVPGLWRYEVANGLQVALRRKRIDVAFRNRALAHLSTLSISTDTESESYAWSESVQLAERYTLTVYDAAYLELALRRRLPLATLDTALIRAASAESVTLLGMS